MKKFSELSFADAMAALAFSLPEERIALYPSERREESRLLQLSRAGHIAFEGRSADLPSRLQAGDLLVFNQSMVRPSRLLARKQSGGRVEVLLLRALGNNEWQALLKPSKSIRVEMPLSLANDAVLTPLEALGEGRWRVRCALDSNSLAAIAEMPLPPYIRGKRDYLPQLDNERYQTVYARELGSAAAPTAGLHFSEGLLAELRAKGVELGYCTLHVGLGTFQPLREEQWLSGRLHEEEIDVPQALIEQIAATKERGGRVIAVGTTACRSLESAARQQRLAAFAGCTDLFIRPGDDFRVVDGIVTNFHTPGSSLLFLVAAFIGPEALLRAYQHAMREGYRFYSYGDAMLIL